MIPFSRRKIPSRHRRRRHSCEFPVARIGTGQAEGGGDRRRAGRRDARQIRRQGFERRHRGDAGRAAAAVRHLLPFQPLSRRLPLLRIDRAFLRRAGVEARRQARAPDGGRHRPRQEDRAARRRHAAVLRPAGGGARHRHQVRLPCRAIRRPPPRRCRTPGSPGRRRSCSSASSTRSRTAPPS